MLIAQLSDTHVGARGADAHLASCVARVNALRPLPDVVVVSGDLADTATTAQYARLGALLGRLAPPTFVVPGNHDRREALHAALPSSLHRAAPGGRLRYAVDEFPVRLLALDTLEARHPGGHLDEASLTWLDERLREMPGRPTFVFLHHPPFRTGVRAADLLPFTGIAPLRAVLARHPQVRRVVAGHVHCVREARIGDAPAITAPSTAPKLVPELFERRPLWVRREPGGFVLHRWTGVEFATSVR